MNTSKLRENVFYKEETVSTNNDAMDAEQAAEGSIFLAERQTGGKGSKGRVWQSETGDGIWMSILLFPKLSPEDIPKITLTAGLAVCKAIRKKGFAAEIKWPNDVVISGKKVCGILAEKREKKVAVGIGINVNTEKFDGELKQRATSLYMESGKIFEREELLNSVADEFEELYKILCEKGFSHLRDTYKAMCATVGKKIKVILPIDAYEAEATDITAEGELVILHDGKEERLCSGEVSVRGIYGYV